MSDLRVNRIQSIDGSSTVEFATGVSGNAEGLRFEPKVTAFDPTNLATGVDRNLTHINVTFNQPIEFSGVGTVRVRAGFATGTVYEEYTCGVSTNLLISGETLRINLTSGTLDGTTNYFVTLPSVGIANTYTQYYKGTEQYVFTTKDATFNVDGGDYEQIVYNGASPTNYYKYNVFHTSGIATFSAPSASAEDFAYILIGGGGGGGQGDNFTPAGRGGGGGAGGLINNYNSTGFDVGELTVTIGAGGNGTYSGPTNPTFVMNSPGDDSSIGPTPVGTITALGGGRAGMDFYGYPTPGYEYPASDMAPRYGQPGGSGGGATRDGTPPQSTNYYAVYIPGGDALGYPGPAAQGYPGGRTFKRYQGNNEQSFSGGGGGGAGGQGTDFQPYNPFNSLSRYNLPGSSAKGGPGIGVPAFPSSVLSYLNGFPSDIYQAIGPAGYFAGGGGGSVWGSNSKYPTNPPSPSYFTPTTAGEGGQGGGGRGYWASNPPIPFASTAPSLYANKGIDGTGGGGGGGFMGYPYDPNTTVPQLPPTFTPPSYPFPQTSHGSAPGGSGGLYIRYAHPGSV